MQSDEASRCAPAEFNPDRAVANQPYILVRYVDPLIDPLHGGCMERKRDISRDEVYGDPAKAFGELGKRMIFGS